MRTGNIWILCTGLGRISRGFESHSSQLALLLSNSKLKENLVLLSGKKVSEKVGVKNISIFSLHRNHWLIKILFKKNESRFIIEQLSFFFSLIPYLVLSDPKIIYLGEYELYCYLYKFRKFFNLNFSLCLHTGGLAVPGLFDENLDFIHHITPYLKNHTNQYPESRQFEIPHFFNSSFNIDDKEVQHIKKIANGKLIWLSVGSIDTHFKRMDILCNILAPFSNKIFPIILGESTSETPKVISMFNESFGINGFYFGKIPRIDLGSYYTAADAFILCTEMEPFGLVFLEAAYFGLPIYCNDNEVIRQILPTGINYMNMNDLVQSKDYINQILDNKQPTKKSIQLIEYVEANYSVNTLSSRYIDMFTKMKNTIDSKSF